MPHRTCWVLFSLLALLASLVPGALAGPAAAQAPAAGIDPQILAEMAQAADGTTGFFILFREHADLTPALAMTEWQQRGQWVYQALRRTAASSQQQVRAWLDAQGLASRSFLAENALYVQADRATLDRLAGFPEIASFRANYRHPLEPVAAQKDQAAPEGLAWNIQATGADRVWNELGVQGQGIVVAGIDTGVDVTHPALAGSYKCADGGGADCWYDPSSVCPDPTVPCDNMGHGTHTMGTMVGSDDPALPLNVGMAPGAQWIACKGCENEFCSDYALTACADWLLAPNGNPDNRPHVVNNSWSGYGCNPWYDANLQAWRAAGIFPAFSAGNAGPGCSSVGSPADSPDAFASGAVDADGVVAEFSGRGPSCSGEIKPEVTAPGVGVCSSVPGGSFECAGWNGTSMASPHTAGLVALLWSADPALVGDLAATEYLITSTASCADDTSCGGEACRNNSYGSGRIDAYNAVAQVASAGALAGHIYDDGGAPLAGVEVQAARSWPGPFVTTTGPDGAYSLTLPVDSYTVSAALYGYISQEVGGVDVISGGLTTQDLTLTAVPLYALSGVVRDAQSGWPLYARIDFHGDPIDPPQGTVWTDPLTGAYSLTLAGATTYTMEVEAWVPGYLPATLSVGPLTGPQVQDVGLTADLEACVAPGRWQDLPYYQDFESGDGGFTVSGTTPSWEWGVPTSGPDAAHSGIDAWATNLGGGYTSGEDSYLTSPSIDLGAYSGQYIYLSWWQWLQTEPWTAFGSVEVSNDGGATWRAIYGEAHGSVDLEWTGHVVLLDPDYAVAGFQLRFHLRANMGPTRAGYYVDDIGIRPIPATPLYSQDFEADDGGYTVAVSTTSSWEWGAPTGGPGSAHSGSSAWATSLGGEYGNDEDGAVESPPIDLSAYAGQDLYLSWWQWLQTESGFDYASVEASGDGGASWNIVYGQVSGDVDLSWNQHRVLLDPAYATGNFRVRFRLRSDSGYTMPGFYIDDVALAAAPALSPTCVLQPGGLVVGSVLDANTGGPLPGALVQSSRPSAAIARPVADDPAGSGALYALFFPDGAYWLTATVAGGYLEQAVQVTVVPSATVGQDFYLPAGLLEATPGSISLTLQLGQSTTLTVALDNLGGAAAGFQIQEQDWSSIPLPNLAPAPAEPFSAPAPVGPMSTRSAEGRAALRRPGGGSPLAWGSGSEIPGGTARYAGAQCPDEPGSFYVFSGVDNTFAVTARSWRYDAAADSWTELRPIPEGQEGPSAVCYEGRIYVLGGGGTNQFYIYDRASGSWLAGAPLPRKAWGAAVAAWDGRIYMVGGDSDFYAGGTSAAVNVYDIAGDSWVGEGTAMPAAAVHAAFAQVGPYLYLVGGWDDSSPEHNVAVTQRYDLANDRWEVGPAWTGARADMPVALTAQALYALGGDAEGGGFFDMTDTVNRLAWPAWPAAAWTDLGDPLPQPSGGNKGGFCTPEAGGGRIWSVGGFNPSGIAGTTLYRAGEPCWGLDVPWLSAAPVSGTIGAGGSAALQVTVDAGVAEVDQPGQYRAALRVGEDTPYAAPLLPVTLNVPQPAGWGRLAGSVYSLGYCDAETVTLPGAGLRVESDGGAAWDLQADPAGTYQRWLEQGSYTVTVQAPGQVTQSARVTIRAGEVYTHDVYLRLEAPCLAVSPVAVEVWMSSLATRTVPLQLDNRGSQALDFRLFEMSGTVGLGRGASSARPLAGTVCIFRDVPPWDLTAVEDYLAGQGISYTIHPAADFGTLDLAGCGMIVIQGNQPGSFYDTYGAYVDRLEEYLYNGGFVNFFACNYGGFNAPLPGGMTWVGPSYQPANTIVDPAHPVVQNVPSPFYGEDASEGYFANLPAGAHVIAVEGEGPTGQPTIVTYPLGRGRLIAFAQPLEYSYYWGWQAGPIMANALLWGYGFVPAGEAPWLDELPLSGTVGADSSGQVSLVLTTVLSEPLPAGSYTATVFIRNSDTRVGTIAVPVVMHVSYRVYLPVVVKD